VKLGQVFDPRNNALNAFRLALAVSVILSHSFVVTGREMRVGQVAQLLTEGGVDGFFALSGFLITSSWLRHPQLRDYVVARALRILPGFYICLIVTAFVIAPVGVAIQHGPAMKLLLSTAPIEYVLENSAVATLKVDVGGTPQGIPYPGTWNNSLWTLIFELACYVAVAVIGIIGLASRRWVSPAILALAVLAAALLPTYTVGADFGANLGAAAARFGIMFAAGALLYQFRDVIPARWSLVVVSAGVVLAAACLMPDYKLVAALPFAYALIVSGALIRNKHFSLRTDLSYGIYIYGFPIQQLLIICGLAGLHPVVFAVVATIATLPLAALSWFLVEKRAMSLKRRLIRKTAAPPLPAAGGNRDTTAVRLVSERPAREVPE
jgi:peptidoglycan/LPS O-acetylase OafA/YrhL